MIDLRRVIKDHPRCLDSRTALRSTLKDLYPKELRLVNVILAVYESGIAGKIYSSIQLDANDVDRFIMQLDAEYGIQHQYAKEAINLWRNAAGVYIIETVEQTSFHSTKTAGIQHDPINYSRIPVEGNSDDYETTNNADGSISIAKFRGFESQHMTVPNSINGKRVTGIGRSAFSSCKTIESVEIAEGIVFIEDAAFMGCQSLKSVRLPQSLKRLGSIPKKVNTYDVWANFSFISEGVFSGCPIANIQLPSGLEYIGKQVFSGNCALLSIDLPNGITELSEGLFSGCRNLIDVVFPDYLQQISESAFSGCHSLKKIELPNPVQCVSAKAFSDCANLTYVQLNEGLRSIKSGAFKGCDRLTQLVIPRSVSEIAMDAFWTEKTTYLGGKSFTLTQNLPNLKLFCYAGSYGVEYARQFNFPLGNAADL